MSNQNDVVTIRNVPTGLLKGSGATMRSVRCKYPKSETGYAGVMIKTDWVENSLNLDYYDLYIPANARLNISYKSGGQYVEDPVSAEEFKRVFDESRSMNSVSSRSNVFDSLPYDLNDMLQTHDENVPF